MKDLSENATIFPKPPVELAGRLLMPTRGHPGSARSKQNAHRAEKRLRDATIRMYMELAHYVEANYNDDLATFLLSGFQPMSSAKAPPQPLEQPTIASVAQGAVTGQLKIKIGAVPKASYTLR